MVDLRDRRGRDLRYAHRILKTLMTVLSSTSVPSEEMLSDLRRVEKRIEEEISRG